MSKINILKIDNISTPIKIVDGKAVFVGENGVGKTVFLQTIAKGDFTIDKDEYNVYHFGFDNIDNTAQRIIDLINIHTEDEFLDFLLEHIPNHVMHLFTARLTLEDLTNPNLDQNIALRRYVLLKMLLEIDHTGDIILCDEPEILAHPLIRNEIIVLLKELNNQGHLILLATNLDNVVTDFVDDAQQVVRLKIIDTNVEITQLDINQLNKKIYRFYHNDPKLLRRFSNDDQVDYGLRNITNQNYASYLGSALKDRLFDIAFANYAIIGEGASEKVLFDYVNSELHPSWIRENRITFISCLGKSTMPLYFLYLNELGIKVICMADYDNDHNLVHNAYRKAFEKYQNDNPTLFRFMEINPDIEQVLRIQPKYRLESIEKPVNIYLHTFVDGKASWGVNNLMARWYELIEEMDELE